MCVLQLLGFSVGICSVRVSTSQSDDNLWLMIITHT